MASTSVIALADIFRIHSRTDLHSGERFSASHGLNATDLRQDLNQDDAVGARPRSQHGEGLNGLEQSSLPSADGGKDAWLFLAGCFMIEALVWVVGFPFSYGVFQKYYSTHLPFSAQSTSIASIGTTATGILYLGAPFVFILLQTYPGLRPVSCWAGLATIIISLIASSFSTQVWHLILTQGVLYALGGSFLYAPTILYLDEWFVQKKGLAFGMMWAGTGTAGVAVPLIMTWGLSRYSFNTMLRVWSITLFVLAGPLLHFIRPRIPVLNSAATQRRPNSFAFLKQSTFWFLQASNIIQGLGYFLPTIYLPTYATALGVSPFLSSSTVVLINGTSVIATILLGLLVDRLHVTTVMLIPTIGAAISVVLLWGLSSSSSIGCLFAFCIFYGAIAGGFSSCYTGMGTAVQRKSPGAEIGTLFGMFSAGRGVGAVVSGPLSEVLIHAWEVKGKIGLESEYGGLMVFTGITAFCGSVGFLGRRIGLM